MAEVSIRTIMIIKISFSDMDIYHYIANDYIANNLIKLIVSFQLYFAWNN